MTDQERIQELTDALHAFEALKRNDINAIYGRIGDAIRPYYDDVQASQDDEMDVELGEIYRETLKNIFKALKREGVRL